MDEIAAPPARIAEHRRESSTWCCVNASERDNGENTACDSPPKPRLTLMTAEVRETQITEAFLRHGAEDEERDLRRALWSDFDRTRLVLRGLDPLRRILSSCVAVWRATRERHRLARLRVLRLEANSRRDLCAAAADERLELLGVGCAAQESCERARLTSHCLMLLFAAQLAACVSAERLERLRLLFRRPVGGALWERLVIAENDARNRVSFAAHRQAVDDVVELHLRQVEVDESSYREEVETAAAAAFAALVRLEAATTAAMMRREVEHEEHAARREIDSRQYDAACAALRRALRDGMSGSIVSRAVEVALMMTCTS